MFYGVTIKQLSGGAFEVSCRDIPDYKAEAATREEADKLAADFVPACMMLFYRRKKKAIPLPSKVRKGEEPYYMPAKVQAKILLWNYMVSEGLRITDVAKKLEISFTAASRLVDLVNDVASVDAVEAAMLKLGKSFTLMVE